MIQANVLPPVRQERDKFAAFAFAGNDLLIETDLDGAITFTAGGFHHMLGAEAEDLADSLFDLVVPEDRLMVAEVFHRLTLYGRIDRVVVRLVHARDGVVHARLSAISMSELRGHLHFGLARVPVPLPASMAARGVTALPDYLNADDFMAMTEQRLREAAQVGEDLSLTLLDVDTNGFAAAAGIQGAERLDREIQGMLRAWGGDAGAVGAFGNGRYAVLHRTQEKPARWEDRVDHLAREIDPLAAVDCAVHCEPLDSNAPQQSGNMVRRLVGGFRKAGRRLFDSARKWVKGDHQAESSSTAMPW